MEEGVRRWAVNVSKWCPSPQDFSSALSILPPSQHPSVLRFVKSEDRKRALVSRLLQYALLHQVLGIPYEQISIERTLEGKPYLECDKDVTEFPNFNFNVSHHGDYVAIASEPLCLVGLDIVSCTFPWKETVPEFIQNFSSYFSRLEWDFIIGAGNEEQILVEFYRYWCLKEAYVKAIGSGLACGLDRVEFHHTGWTNISVKISGTFSPHWKFWLLDLGEKHYISIARGHPRSATESYKSTLKRAEFSEDEYLAGFHLPDVSFVLQTVEQLISILQDAKKARTPEGGAMQH
ncbi:hypothetical protein EUGRSUZ_J00256 [Eucalyptus grandis]|uniref:Uncharacterized protein n=2 Tax=Eucalyptus grandis TaxID=71139 RepID=A0ACC3J188_EUCGR|nr:hypothetical protein EUGRSUZ_J00256 [Eucalyptus grandis]